MQMLQTKRYFHGIHELLPNIYESKYCHENGHTQDLLCAPIHDGKLLNNLTIHNSFNSHRLKVIHIAANEKVGFVS